MYTCVCLCCLQSPYSVPDEQVHKYSKVNKIITKTAAVAYSEIIIKISCYLSLYCFNNPHRLHR